MTLAGEELQTNLNVVRLCGHRKFHGGNFELPKDHCVQLACALRDHEATFSLVTSPEIIVSKGHLREVQKR